LTRSIPRFVEYLEAIGIAVVVAVVLRWAFPGFSASGPSLIFWAAVAFGFVLLAIALGRIARR
jgi:hypothetical protein